MRNNVFDTLIRKIERAARTGKRLHLDLDEVRAIISSSAYPVMQEVARQELISTWRDRSPSA